MTAIYVYRAFDADGGALYVGQTKDPLFRFRQHKHVNWYARIARVRMTVHRTRQEAREVERAEIWRLLPAHNFSLAKPVGASWTPAHMDRADAISAHFRRVRRITRPQTAVSA